MNIHITLVTEGIEASGLGGRTLLTSHGEMIVEMIPLNSAV